MTTQCTAEANVKIQTLDELLELMRGQPSGVADDWIGNDWRAAGLPEAHGERDWSALPVFGGPAPHDTSCVWSWDETRLIVGTCSDDVEIVNR